MFAPAADLTTHSVGSQRERRAVVEGLTEMAWGQAPSYWWSERSVFLLTQPEGVLGSSFATPLVAGLAALMEDRHQLFQYREVERLAGLAGALMGEPDEDEAEVWVRRQDVTRFLFERALAQVPSHDHLLPFLELASGEPALPRRRAVV